MINIKITFSYNGIFFNGSAPQSHKHTVFDTLQIALSSFGFKEKLIFSSRTDKGVHALNQVANINIPSLWIDKLHILKEQLNKKLTYIYIKNIKQVHYDFHSRFSASKRVYRYIISPVLNTPFDRDYYTYVPIKDINEDILKKSIKVFEGKWDFEYFMAEGSESLSSIREVYEARFYKYKQYYVFYFKANSYLRKQIRLMVGFLLQISKGVLSIDDLARQLKKEQFIYKKPALPSGLYLSKIIYK